MASFVYEVRLKSSAQKELRSVEVGIRNRVIDALKLLSNNPRPHGCRKLIAARNRWRIRVGDYRVIYTIDERSLLVEIIAVRHRSKAYD
jgi:mRNA interferase RelE/StbE